MDKFILFVIILIVFLIYLSFSCYETFATTSNDMAVIYKDKKTNLEISRNNKTNTFKVKSNVQVDGDFGVKGKLSLDGKDIDTVLNTKLSPYAKQEFIDEKLKDYTPSKDCLLKNELDTKLTDYVTTEVLNENLSKYALTETHLTNESMNKLLEEGIVINKDKNICIDDLCLTYQDIANIKAATLIPSSTIA